MSNPTGSPEVAAIDRLLAMSDAELDQYDAAMLAAEIAPQVDLQTGAVALRAVPAAEKEKIMLRMISDLSICAAALNLQVDLLVATLNDLLNALAEGTRGEALRTRIHAQRHGTLRGVLGAWRCRFIAELAEEP